MILYQEGGTTSHYNVGEDGRINAGPYLGLTLNEARELNQAQRSKYQEDLKTRDRQNFMGRYNKAMDETFNDYMIPAMKTVSSFTPAGPVIGAIDAYNAWDRGDRGWAIAGAGLEALPYGLKYAKKIPWKHVGNVTNDVLGRINKVGVGKHADEVTAYGVNPKPKKFKVEPMPEVAKSKPIVDPKSPDAREHAKLIDDFTNKQQARRIAESKKKPYYDPGANRGSGGRKRFITAGTDSDYNYLEFLKNSKKKF